jgi:hypothetical protein
MVMAGPWRSIAPSAPLSVGTGLVPDRLQLRNAILRHQVGQIGDTVFDGVMETLELGVGLGRPRPQLGDITFGLR